MGKKHEKENFDTPYSIKMNPNSLVIFKERQFAKKLTGYSSLDHLSENGVKKPTEKKIRSNISNGFISPKAAARLQTYVKYLFWLSGCYRKKGKKMELICTGKITFLTLSLSAVQIDSDNYIKSNMLNQFITELSKRYHGLLYIWRAEKQKNGNIHFHFLTNKFIHWEIARNIWNRIQAKEGYLQRYQEKFSGLWFEQYLLTISNPKINLIDVYKRRWIQGNNSNWSNPNSIDIVQLKSMKAIYHYISKYMSKNEREPNEISEIERENLKIVGHIYFCCKELTSIESPKEWILEDITHDLNLIKSAFPDVIYNSQFFTLIKLSIEQLYNIGCFFICNLFFSNLLKYKPTGFFPI